MSIYWVPITKISVCEGCEGCTARKSGPDWRLVCETYGDGGGVPVVPDLSPRYTNFSQLNIGLRATQTFLSLTSLRAELPSRTLQKRIKIGKCFSALRAEFPFKTLHKRIKIVKFFSALRAEFPFKTLHKRINNTELPLGAR